jgi:hypothetical protein
VYSDLISYLLIADNRVFGWGLNRAIVKGGSAAPHTLLGFSSTSDFVPPTEIPGISGQVLSLACGEFHTVIVTSMSCAALDQSCIACIGTCTDRSHNDRLIDGCIGAAAVAL